MTATQGDRGREGLPDVTRWVAGAFFILLLATVFVPALIWAVGIAFGR